MSGSDARVCRVLPDVPAVDRAFDYLVPDDLADQLTVGTIVRVPLHGRRVRGWVLKLDVEPEADRTRLLPIHAVVSAGPPAELVELSEWAAWRWAGPRVAFLRATSPPNNVKEPAPADPDAAVFPTRDAPVELPTGSPRAVRWPPARSRADLVAALVAAEGSTIVIAPDARETGDLVSTLEAEGRHVLVLRSELGDAERTRVWADARRGATVVVGGRIAAGVPVPDLASVIVLDDVDEALEEERAPAWHAFPLLIERTRRLGARADIVSPTPSVEAIHAATSAPSIPAREVERGGWPRVGIVDVRYEPPGKTLLTERLADTLRRSLDDGGRVLCVLNRKGRARLLVCPSCSEIARCPECGAALCEGIDNLHCDRCTTRTGPICLHCGAAGLRPRRLGVTRVREHLAALAPRARVVAVEAGSAPVPAFDVAIGTEAVLHRAPVDPDRPIQLVAFLDVDQELLAPRYRAEEQALWLLVRAARRLGERSAGGTLLVQTRMPEHPVLVAARDGDPTAVLEADLARRRELGYPPFGGLAELSGEAAAVDAACVLLGAQTGVTVLGPRDGRALVRAASIDELCDTLAAVDLGAARAAGRLRVDVDPRRV
ncbi:MAG: hypothetical protein FJW86_09990 [Actinobacteria bacterium]|nr:hypothetical protein [Actinomycetota bacterium]